MRKSFEKVVILELSKVDYPITCIADILPILVAGKRSLGLLLVETTPNGMFYRGKSESSGTHMKDFCSNCMLVNKINITKDM